MPPSSWGRNVYWWFTGPGDQTRRRWSSGAAEGWVTFPTAGDFGSLRTERSAGPSPFSAKGVRLTVPTGRKGRWYHFPLPLSNRPKRSAVLRGSPAHAGANPGRPGGAGGSAKKAPKPLLFWL